MSERKNEKKEYEQVYECLLFRNMERKRAKEIISGLNGTVEAYEKRSIVIGEEEPLKEIGILLSGNLCKVQLYSDGTEQMVQKLEPGYVVGLEVAVSAKKTSPYCIYAVNDAKVYWFPVRYLEEEGSIAEKDRIAMYQQVVYYLANEDIRKYKKIEILSVKSAREKIEKYLKTQIVRYQSKEFDIDFNREQLANYLSLNRSVLSHELKKMEKEGMIKVNKNHFIVYK